jgi:hypothetical protein
VAVRFAKRAIVSLEPLLRSLAAVAVAVLAIAGALALIVLTAVASSRQL